MVGTLALLLAIARPTARLQGDANAQVDAALADLAKQPGFVGGSVAVVKDGKIVVARGIGKTALEHGRDVRPDDRFAVGSITKEFTAACAMLLAEDGKLSPDDPVAKYLPGITAGDRITLRQLMGHVSGLRDYYPLDYVDAEMARPTTPQAIVAEYGRMALDFEPGTHWSYSNTNYTVLGLVLEKVSGESLGRLMRERIFRPLGMTRTTFESHPQRAKGIVRGYNGLGFDTPRPADGEGDNWAGAAGAIVTTPSDLALWDIALMEGRLLRPASLAAMTTLGRLSTGASTGYGLGLEIGSLGGEPLWEHSGGVEGFVSENAMVPSRRTAVVLLANSFDANPFRPAQALLATVVGLDLSRKAPVGTPPPAPRTPPTVAGPPAEEALRGLLAALADGHVDASLLTDDFRAYLTPGRLKEAAASLARWGAIVSITPGGMHERGGMRVAGFTVRFATGDRRLSLWREPNGRIAELFLSS